MNPITILATSVATILPDVLLRGFEYLTSNDEPKESTEVKVIRVHDTYKFDEDEYKHICDVYQNMSSRGYTQQAITAYLNQLYRLDKSVGSYRRIWKMNGLIKSKKRSI